MSTVHEVLAAAELGCACASLSCITNRATGLSTVPLTHDEVTVVADRGAAKLRAVLDRFTAAELESAIS
jgi:purine-nucleoside phosphorylase